MKKINITTRFKRNGALIPIEFILEDNSVQVLDVGRQWETKDGKHILVMDSQGHTHHLFFQSRDLGWYLIHDQKPHGELS